MQDEGQPEEMEVDVPWMGARMKPIPELSEMEARGALGSDGQKSQTIILGGITNGR
jgi:hypothetical protein